MSRFSDRIRRRETPFYDWLYRFAKRVRGFEMPMWQPLAKLLRAERDFRVGAWRNFWRVMYYQPLFRSHCDPGGSVHIEGKGMPLVMGNPRIVLGDRVRINALTTISGHRDCLEPTLAIGDDSYVGYGVSISVGSRLTIGDRVLIASRVFLGGYDGHPIDPVERAAGRRDPVPSELVIENDVWIGSGTFIGKGVRVGRCAVVAAHSVVTRDVPSGAVVGGNPAKVIRVLEDLPSELSRDTEGMMPRSDGGTG